jgi:integrase
MKGSMRQRSAGSWELRFDMGVDASGKRQQKNVTFRGTKREAQAELNRILHELATGLYAAPSKMTVADYLTRWLKDYAGPKVAPKTFERYQEIVRIHLTPDLGHHALTAIRPLHIQAAYTKALESGRKDGKGGLSAQTVLHHHRILREALEQAVKWQLLARNPADAVEPPRPGQKEMNALDEEQTVRLLKAAEGTRLYVPVVLAIATGLRRGELLGLRWADLNLEAGTLTVNRTLQVTRKGISYKEPKTRRSRRTIPLPAFAVEVLLRHKGKQAETKLRLGPAYHDNGLVIAGEDGRPLDANNHLTKAFPAFVKSLGLPHLRFHELRHSHASQLLKRGIPVGAVSERIGHARTSTTLDIYGHVLAGQHDLAAKEIHDALRDAF